MPQRAGEFLALVAYLSTCVPVLAADAEQPSPPIAQQDIPRLDWSQPIYCVQSKDGKKLRVQCMEQGPDLHCLVAPNQQANGTGLERTQDCNWAYQETYDYQVASGVRMLPALAETPPGWHRDEKGRVFQVDFDLMKRFLLGVAWFPSLNVDDPASELGRVRFEMGLEASFLVPESRNRHTVRALSGFAAIENLEVAGSLFGYDLSHASSRPLMRITTFFGRPERHDAYLDLGWGMRLLDVHYRPHQTDIIGLQIVEAHTAWDLWQSADLRSHLRLETGVALEGLWSTDRDTELAGYAATPGAALRAQFELGKRGFHHLLTDLHWSMPVGISGDRTGQLHSRAGAQAAWEVMFIAINDQPLTFRLQAAADYRDDLPGMEDAWDASLLLGMRFSFWVPARTNIKLPTVANR